MMFRIGRKEGVYLSRGPLATWTVEDHTHGRVEEGGIKLKHSLIIFNVLFMEFKEHGPSVKYCFAVDENF